MGRLFDSGADRRASETARKSKDEVRKRALEVERILEEEKLVDAAGDELGQKLAAGRSMQAVQPIRYESFRQAGTKWMLEHAQDGEDYVIQMFPLKPPLIPWQDVVTMLIAAMDVIFPRSVQIKYVPPNETYEVKFYTIRILKVVGLPGWEKACKDRALNGLAAVEAWPS